MKEVLTIVAVCACLALGGCDEQGSPLPSTGQAETATSPRPAAADPEDWCRGHQVPESMCTKCNPELIEASIMSSDWCPEHGFPESVCPHCNPLEPPIGAEMTYSGAGNPADWCGGHRLPESKCTKCNPELTAKFKDTGDWCDAHGFPESACPQCNPMRPPSSEGNGAVADWCGGHALPESMCTKCNSELTAEFKAAGDYCEEHGFPESACPVCNPMEPPQGLENLGDWCLEHALPESKCTQCNTSLVEEYKDAGDWCPEHGYPESVCPVCNPQTPPQGAERAAIEARVVRLQTPDLEDTVGISTERAVEAEDLRFVDCTARIAFDRDRLADVRALLPGVVRTIHVEQGQSVGEKDPLFELQSPGVGEVQVALRGARQRVSTARQNLNRKRELLENKITSVREVELAEQELAAAKAELQGAETTLKMVGASSDTSGTFALSAPLSGTVVRRPAIVGMYAMADTSLATIADTSVMWALCDVPESLASTVAIGMPMEVRIRGREGGPLKGEITWIDAEVDLRTRTVTARAELQNSHGELRANQFAHARIEINRSKVSVAVPRAALQRVGEIDIVFVRVKKGVFEPRVVERVSQGGGDRVSVTGSVSVGDAVVTTGGILLRTEILPGSIGAGCCEVEGGD